MSIDNLHSEFDKILRDKFEGAETPIPKTKWDRIDNAMQENADPFDSILRNRFKEGMQPPEFNIPDVVPPRNSSQSKNSKKWGWFVLALLVSITPMAYSLLKSSDKHKESNTLFVKEHNTKEQKSTESIKSIEKYSRTKKDNKSGAQLSENSSTASTQIESQSVRKNKGKNSPTERQENFVKTPQQTVKKTGGIAKSDFKKSITPPNSIDKKIKKEKNIMNLLSAKNAEHKNTKNNIESNDSGQRKSKNSSVEVSQNSILEVVDNPSPEKNTPKPSIEKNSEEKKSSDLINSNKLTIDSNKQSREFYRNISKTSNSKSSVESNELKSKSPVVSNKENKIKARKIMDGNKGQLAQDGKQNTIKDKTKKDTKPAQTSQQKESIKVDSKEKFKPFRLSIGAYVYCPFTNTSSTNSSYKTLYQIGQIKEWNINAELQGEYRLNKRWSIGSGISTSSYDISIGENNFERNKTNNIHLDTTNKMVLFQSSLGQAQVGNLNSFEFGSTTLNNPGQSRDSLNSFAYEEVQSFKFIQIPFFLQYTGGKGKFHYSIGAGPLLSLITKASSSVDIYNAAFPSTRVTITNYHKTNNVLWGATSRLGFHYDISSRFGMYARPTFNYLFTDFSKISLLSIYHHNLRIPLGINYIF